MVNALDSDKTLKFNLHEQLGLAPGTSGWEVWQDVAGGCGRGKAGHLKLLSVSSLARFVRNTDTVCSLHGVSSRR